MMIVQGSGFGSTEAEILREAAGDSNREAKIRAAGSVEAYRARETAWAESLRRQGGRSGDGPTPEQVQMQAAQQEQERQKRNRIIAWVAGGVGAVALLGGVIAILRRRRK